MSRPAAFVDRDGTLIREREYLSDPAGVELLPGAVEGLRRLEEKGYRIVIVTNQSGIARGLYGEEEYRAVEGEVVRQLEASGVVVTATYHCPHHPEWTGPCRCRKPEPGMILSAAADHGLDPARSVYIGDRVRDVAMAASLGGSGYLVRTGYGRAEAAGAPGEVVIVDDLEEAAARAPDRTGPGS